LLRGLIPLRLLLWLAGLPPLLLLLLLLPRFVISVLGSLNRDFAPEPATELALPPNTTTLQCGCKQKRACDLFFSRTGIEYRVKNRAGS